MKKYIFQIILISSVFLYENTSAYWIYQLGEWVSAIRLMYIIVFICTIGITIFNIFKCIQAKLKDIRCNIITILMIIVLITPVFMSGGLIPKRLLYDGDLLVAYLDGVAGNNGWLTLYGNNTYEYIYGIELKKGKYKIKGDTIFFGNSKGEEVYDFDYATLLKDKLTLSFGKDSLAYSYMNTVRNELIK